MVISTSGDSPFNHDHGAYSSRFAHQQTKKLALNFAPLVSVDRMSFAIKQADAVYPLC